MIRSLGAVYPMLPAGTQDSSDHGEGEIVKSDHDSAL
jgi:hypothetical protein